MAARQRRTIPKYYRISQDIIGRIKNGDLTPGELVPSENEIIKKYKVSNTTARKALLELEQTNWVTRIKGKGTYVRDGRLDRSATRILGFTRNMLEAGRNPSTRLIGATLRRRSRSLTIQGRCYTLPSPICEITRLRLADGVPVMRETRFISAQLCPDLEEKDLETSLYDIYEHEYGLQLARTDQMLSAIVIDGKDGAFPGLEAKVPGFLVEGVTFCTKELILEIEESIYRGDIYRFSVRAMS